MAKLSEQLQARVDDETSEGKRPPGRPRTRGTIMPVYDGMEQAANATGIPLHLLRAAKKDGCLFYRAGKVHIGEFIHWFFEEDRRVNDDDGIDWAARLKRANALIREQDFEESRGELIKFASVDTFLAFLVNQTFFGELERMSKEYPAALKGSTEIKISTEVEAQVSAFKKKLEKILRDWLALQKKGGKK